MSHILGATDITIPDSGWVNLRVPLATAGEFKEKVIDLFAFYNNLVAVGRDHEQAKEFDKALSARQQWMEKNGFNGVSESAVSLVMTFLWEAIKAYKKKAPSTADADSPTSTGSSPTPEPEAPPPGS